MLALRSLARSAPRAVSRIASTRPAFPSNFLRPSPIASSSQLHRIAASAFSTTRARFDENAQHLAAKLEEEIKIEQSESHEPTGSDKNVKAFINDNPDWEIQDTVGENNVYFVRQFEDETVTVHFSIADFDQEFDDDIQDEALGDEYSDLEEGQSGGGNTKGAINQGKTGNSNFKIAPEDSIAPADREDLADEEDESAQAFPVGVTVLVQRPNKGALKFFLVTGDGELQIQKIEQIPQSTTTDAKELIQNSPESSYPGPPFRTLDEEVQDILGSYLAARGVTEYLAQVIPDYIDVKEQKEYLEWLRRVKDFVE